MKIKYLWIFLAVAYGVSYALWITVLLLPEGRSTYLFAGLSFMAMVGPLLGTLTVKRLGWKPTLVTDPPPSSRIRTTLLAAAILYLVLWLTQFGLQTALTHWQGNLAFPLDRLTLGRFFARTLFMPAFWLFSVFLEEFGWRYFLYREARRLGPWAATWGVGLVWALWHVPAAFVLGKDNAPAMILNYLIYVPILHQFLAYFYDQSQSLWTTVILHAIFNGFGTAYYYTSGLLTRPDQMLVGDLRVNLGVNLSILFLLLPFSWLLFRRIQAGQPIAQPSRLPDSAAS